MKYLILENIRSAYNVGAIFRTADASGVSKIFLVGYTPTPIDRFGRPQKEILKTSLGASEEIEWEHVEDTISIIELLKKKGFTVAAVELGENSTNLKDFSEPDKVAYVLGNEVEGVEEETIKQSDVQLEVPMLGTKESLNVSVTAGIVLYHNLT